MSRLRYSAVSRRMWVDEKFRRLSAPPPNGQTLWFYLLTGPELGCIPGLYAAGEMALAEALGWPLEGFREAFGEVFREGLVKADWKARVVWVPNAIRHNPPASPNVVRSWRSAFDELPDSKLKAEALCGLKTFVEGMGEGFRKGFAEAFGQVSPNQDQDQDQDQEREISDSAPPVGSQVLSVVEPEAPKPKADRRKPQRPMPPPDEVPAWLAALGVPPQTDPEVARWLDWHRARDSRFADWAAAWRTWSRKAAEFGGRPGRAAVQPISSAWRPKAVNDPDDPLPFATVEEGGF